MNKEETKKEIFRGHFEECLNHFNLIIASRAPKHTREATQIKRIMADFCGVDLRCIDRWLRCKNPHGGAQYFRVMCYLDMVGYRVIELERMPKVLRNIAELISFGIISADETVELLQYSQKSQLFAVIRGDYGISQEKEQRAWNIWKQRREDLEKKKEQVLREIYRLDVSPKVYAKAGQASVAAMPMAIVKIMEGLLALLENEYFQGPESSFAEIRQSIDTVLKLSARLNELSSRLIMLKEQKEDS